jgi:hypothetical protein
MTQKLVLSLMFYFLFTTQGARAEIEKPEVQFHVTKNSAAIEKVNWDYKIAPVWSINSDGGTEFFWALQFEIDTESEVTSFQVQNAEVGIKLENKNKNKKQKISVLDSRTINIGMRSLNDFVIVTLKDKTYYEIKIDLKFNRPALIEESCIENNIKVQSANIKKVSRKKTEAEISEVLPTYLAYRCEMRENGTLTLSVSVPKEVEWQSNSLFESKGKGKNWKNFEISPSTISKEILTIGNFTLAYNNQNFEFEIIFEKLEIIRPITVFRLSVGMINIGIENAKYKDAAVKFASFVMFEVRPWDPRFVFGGQGMTSLPTLTKKEFFNHTESIGYLGFTSNQGKNWTFEPRLYAYLAEGVSQHIQFYYIMSTVALGAFFEYAIDQHNRLSLETFFMKAPQQSILTSRFFFTRKNLNNLGGWGLALVSQVLGLNLQDVNNGKGSEIFFGPFLEF